MTFDPADFDEDGQWIHECETCGTNHDGYPPDSIGAEIRCLRAQAHSAGATHLVDQVDALQADLRHRQEVFLRNEGLIP